MYYLSIFLYSHTYWRDFVYSNNNLQKVYQNCKELFHDPRGMGSCDGAWSFEIVRFMILGVWFLVLGRGHIYRIVKMHYFFKSVLLFCWAYIKDSLSL